MTKKTRNWLTAIFIVAFPFALFSLFFFTRLADVPPTPPPVPHPNGYDDLVKAGKMLHPDTGIFSKTNLTQLRQIVSSNAAALALARSGLSNECRVPVQYTAAFNSNHVSDSQHVKFLARAFIAEGWLAEMENRPADAAKSYLDTIHLANEATRGGLLIDKVVSRIIETSGTDHLQKLAPHLDAAASRETAVTLAIYDSQTPGWDEIMQQENTWSHAVFLGWRHDLTQWMDKWSYASALRRFKEKLKLEQKKTRQLIINLAARAYELDKGHPPASVANLEPEYLKAIPQDPITGTNMVYSPR